MPAFALLALASWANLECERELSSRTSSANSDISEQRASKIKSLPETRGSTMANYVDGVPYHVLQLDDGRARALFTVPSHLAEALIKYPIACRSAFFHLHLDTTTATQALQPHRRQKQQTLSKRFLITEYDSPCPEETAKAISRRLANRMADTNPLGIISGILGG